MRLGSFDMSGASSTRSTASSLTGFSQPSSHSAVPAGNTSLNPVQLTLIQMERTLHTLVDSNDLHPILSSVLFSQLYQIKFAMASLTGEERASHLFDEAHPTPQWTNSHQSQQSQQSQHSQQSQPRGIKKRRNSLSENSQASNSSAEDIDSFKLRRQEARDRLRKVGEGIHAAILALQTQIQSYMSNTNSVTHDTQNIAYKQQQPVQHNVPVATSYPAVQPNKHQQHPVRTQQQSLAQAHAELTAVAAYDLSRDHIDQGIDFPQVEPSWPSSRHHSSLAPTMTTLELSLDTPPQPVQPRNHMQPMRHTFAPQQPHHTTHHNQSFTNYRQNDYQQQHQTQTHRQQTSFPEFAPGLIDDSILTDNFNYSQYNHNNGSRGHLNMNGRHHDSYMPDMDSPVHRSVDLAAFAALCLSEEASLNAAKAASASSIMNETQATAEPSQDEKVVDPLTAQVVG